MQIGKKGLIVYLFRFVAPIFSLAFLSTILGVSIASPIQNTNAAGETTIGAEVIRVGFGLSVSVSPNITLDLEPTPTGTMTVGSSIVNAGTSSPSGYTLYLEMTGNNANTNSLIHSTDDTKRLTSSGSFATPVALTNGTWGYAFEHDAESVLSTNGFDSSYSTMESATPTSAKFASIPTSGNPAQKIAETDTIGGVELTVYYGVRVDYATASGAYTNKILYTALADDGSSPILAVSPSTISTDGGESIALTASLYSTFDDIAGDAYLLTPEQYAAVTDAQNPTPVSTYSSQKLTCSRDTTSDPYKLNCTTIAVEDDGTYYIYVDIPRYDQHYANTVTVESSPQYMQDFTSEQCAAMTTGASLTMIDSRDDNEYTIKKLADGHCWMTQNLRLNGGTSGRTLTSSNSDVSSNFTLPAQNTGEWCTTADATCINTANNLYSDNSTYGTYYSWYAATAGTGTYSTTSGNASSSICPKGWRLPTGGDSGEFQALYDQYNSADLMINGAPGFVLSGLHAGSFITNQGSYGYYWSSTAIDSSNVHLFSVNSSSVFLGATSPKYLGSAVRCLAKSFNTLVVDPNGGTWEGSKDTQNFAQTQGTTRTIANPTISVTFNANGQGATYTTPTTAIFNGWTLSGYGDGSFSGQTYTFGGEGFGNTLTASYSITLPTITKSGYTCQWNTQADGMGGAYNSGATIAVNSKNTDLYVVCGAGMQNQTNIDTCKNATVGTAFALADTRDGEIYIVKKLADGNCWMTQNLRLQNKSISSADSNLPSGKTVAIPASSTANWCSTNSAACIDQLMTLDATDTSIPGQSGAQPNYGVYYNWYTATATYGTYSTTSNVSYDICPKGWRLPTGGSSGEFHALYNQYNSPDLLINGAPSFVLSGSRSGSLTTSQDNGGVWWSRSANSNGAFYFLVERSRVLPDYRTSKYHGYSVRCVAQ